MSYSLSYALPALAVYFLVGPISIIQGIYAKYDGLTLPAIAAVILVARIFDTVTDPLVGYFSDKYYAKNGTRKPFVILGAILLLITSYFFFIPEQFSKEVSISYFMVCFFCFYLSLTFFEIPHLAWGSEITLGHKARTRIYGMRLFMVVFGQVLFFSLPLFQISSNSEFTPETLKVSVFLASLLIFPSLLICVFKVPNTNHVRVCKKILCFESYDFGFKSVFVNKPFLLLIAAFFTVHVAAGMLFALLFIFVDAYLGLGDKLPILYLISYGLSSLTLWFWSKISEYLGRKSVWNIGVIISMFGMLLTGMSSPSSDWLIISIAMTMVYVGFAAVNIMAPSLLSDIIDYGRLKSGVDQAATYFSFFNMASKISMALGSAIGLGLAGFYDFDPTVSIHSDNSVMGIRLAISWVPALIILTSTVFTILIPIDERRGEIVRRRANIKCA